MSMPPSCQPGEVPSLNDSKSCWSGHCVPATQCRTVTSCKDCTGTLGCAAYQTMVGPEAHCVEIPASCGGSLTCACAAAEVCTSPFDSCNDVAGSGSKSHEVTCGCPTC
ncbi:MAG: hypothetical protein OZ921_18585 [Sorangiineae bacterium]|nr:hypothetical protein [Sorangiineae bacterium]